ncbi:hypothetical protein F5Y16DRAFT_416014 [Xylariaceae sp. FL0255]|nr:hypothetical protein F5Y16DRAFT_416014 [Xylariaceae sp. FL0255]
MPLTDRQFSRLLEGFADVDVFNGIHETLIFLVYAHNNEGEEANDYVVHLIIKWLKALRAHVLSDKSPTLPHSEYGTSTPEANIIDNQLRLLPGQTKEDIGKIVLYGSKVLQTYCEHSFAAKYRESILALHRTSIQSPQRFEKLIRQHVDAHKPTPGFHHVLTETAFLEIRKQKNTKRHGIIPFVLGSAEMSSHLPFIEPTDVYLSNHGNNPRRMFFKLLKRIYPEKKKENDISYMEQCYTELSAMPNVTDTQISSEIDKSLRRMISNRSARLRAQDNVKAGHFMVPFGRNKNFIGRNALLQQLLEKIPPSVDRDDCQRTAIEGLGGIGKTQIALEAAYMLHGKFADCSVFWVPAINFTTFENAYREIGQLLQLPGVESRDGDVIKIVNKGLGDESAGNWLLIVDNVDDLNLWGSSLSDHIPFSRRGSILFTTRNHNVSSELSVAPGDITQVHEMSEAEATKLLHQGLKSSQIVDSASTQSLLHFLAKLPLAIKQASIFMESNPSVTVSKYLGWCKTSEANRIQLLREEFKDRYRYEDQAMDRNPVATTWLISFKSLDPLAVEYLKFMSLLAEKDIPLSLLPAAQEIDRQKAIGTLQAYAFIKQRGNFDRCDIHRLVRLVMRNWLKENGQWHQLIAIVVKRLMEKYPVPTYKTRKECSRYLPHGQAVLDIDGAINSSEHAKLLMSIGSCYELIGKLSNAEYVYKRILRLNQPGKGALSQEEIIKGKSLIARCLEKQGKYEQAEKQYRSLRMDQEELLGQQHTDTLETIAHIGVLLRLQKKLRFAEEVDQKIFSWSLGVHGIEHRATLERMNELAIVKGQLGNLEEAERIHRQVLETQAKILGERDPDALRTINFVATILSLQGQSDKAKPIRRQVVRLIEETLGTEHPQYVEAVMGLGHDYYLSQDFENAEQTYRGLVEHLQVNSMEELSAVLYEQNKHEEADAINLQALELREKLLRERDPETFANECPSPNEERRTMNKNYEMSERIYRRLFEVQKRVLGDGDPKTRISFNAIAECLADQRRCDEEAESIYREAVERNKAWYTLDKEKAAGFLVKSLGFLAWALFQQEKYKDAEKIGREAFRKKQELFGKEDRNTLNSMHQIALDLDHQKIYKEEQRDEEFEKWQRRTVELSQEVLGTGHTQTIRDIVLLAEFLFNKGGEKEAEKLITEARKSASSEVMLLELDMDQIRDVETALREKRRKRGEAEREDVKKLRQEAIAGYEEVREETKRIHQQAGLRTRFPNTLGGPNSPTRATSELDCHDEDAWKEFPSRHSSSIRPNNVSEGHRTYEAEAEEQQHQVLLCREESDALLNTSSKNELPRWQPRFDPPRQESSRNEQGEIFKSQYDGRDTLEIKQQRSRNEVLPKWLLDPSHHNKLFRRHKKFEMESKKLEYLIEIRGDRKSELRKVLEKLEKAYANGDELETFEMPQEYKGLVAWGPMNQTVYDTRGKRPFKKAETEKNPALEETMRALECNRKYLEYIPKANQQFLQGEQDPELRDTMDELSRRALFGMWANPRDAPSPNRTVLDLEGTDESLTKAIFTGGSQRFPLMIPFGNHAVSASTIPRIRQRLNKLSIERLVSNSVIRSIWKYLNKFPRDRVLPASSFMKIRIFVDEVFHAGGISIPGYKKISDLMDELCFKYSKYAGTFK